MPTLSEIEDALAHQRLYVAGATKSRFYLCRRNGRTKTWKTRPGQFSIPVKAGFSGYICITQDNIDEPGLFKFLPAHQSKDNSHDHL